MPFPPLRDLITPTSTGASLPAQTVGERLLLTLAMLATGTSPDGTPLPGGGNRAFLLFGPLTTSATGVVSGGLVTGTANLALGPLITTATGTIPSGSPPVAGYVAWYDASQITGQSDNTALASWPDLSGNGYTLTAGNQPTYYSTTPGKTVNGKPAVWFTGVHQMSNSTAVAMPQTFFVVGASTALGPIQCFWGPQNGNGISFGVDSSSKLALAWPGNAWIGISNTALTTSPAVCAGTYNGTSFALYINSGTSDITGSISQSLPASGIELGANNTSGSFGSGLTGMLCEVIAYPTVLSAPQITSTYTYLKTKWGTP